MADRYRKRPVVIEAMQWTGANITALTEWAGEAITVKEEGIVFVYIAANNIWAALDVTEWVAKDTLGFYPIKNSVFLQSYELVE